MYLRASFLILIASLCLLLGTSCAWNKGDFFKIFNNDEVDDAQLTKVGANEQELEKFSVQENSPTEDSEISEKQIDIKKKVQPSKIMKKNGLALSTKNEKDPTSQFIYPKDYPPALITLEEKAIQSWSQFKPNWKVGERMMLDVDYLGMTVGKIILGYSGLKKMNDRPVYHFQAFFKSAPFYSAIYELNDRLDTFVDQQEFFGLRYNLVQRESKQDVDEVQLYDHDTLETNAYQKQVRGEKTKNRKWKGFIPRHSIDPLSVLWLIRGMPLKIGDRYTIPIINKGEVVVMEATVEAFEKIKTKLGQFSTIRVQAHTQYTGRTLKSGDMTLWFANDDARALLRAKAKIKIGSVYAEVVKDD